MIYAILGVAVITIFGVMWTKSKPPWFYWVVVLFALWVISLVGCASFHNPIVPMGRRPQAKVVNHAPYKLRVEVECEEFGTRTLGWVAAGDSVIFAVPFGDVPLTVNFYGPNNIFVATYHAEPLDDLYAKEWRWEVDKQ